MLTKELLQKRLSELSEQLEQAKAQANTLHGAVMITKQYLAEFEEKADNERSDTSI